MEEPQMTYQVLVGHGIGGGKFVYPGDKIEVDETSPQEVRDADDKERRGLITRDLQVKLPPPRKNTPPAAPPADPPGSPPKP
jgi:hypothetical protein